jgi:hypothetical protein
MGCGVVALPHLTTYDVSEIDAAVRTVLTEIGGGGRNDPKSNATKPSPLRGRTHVNPWVINA